MEKQFRKKKSIRILWATVVIFAVFSFAACTGAPRDAEIGADSDVQDRAEIPAAAEMQTSGGTAPGKEEESRASGEDPADAAEGAETADDTGAQNGSGLPGGDALPDSAASSREAEEADDTGVPNGADAQNGTEVPGGEDDLAGPENPASSRPENESWKSAYAEKIRALEEKGSGICVIDPDSPDGHHCGYDYCLFYAPGDPVPLLYYRAVVSSLGEGIFRYSEGTLREVVQGDACEAVLAGATELLGEGDAETILSCLE